MSDDAEEKPAARERIKAGTKTPTLSFEEAINIIKQVAKEGGLDGSVDAISQVTKNSASSSSFQMKLSVLKGFGLISVTDKSFAFTDIGRRIVQPESDQDEALAIVESFNTHEYLRRTWENYKGKLLPGKKEHLGNYFKSTFGLPGEFAEAWAAYFTSAALFAKLLHEREPGTYQVLLSPNTSKKAEQELPTNGKPEPEPAQKSGTLIETLVKNPSRPNISVEGGEHWGILSQRRISNDRKAVIAIPDELLQEDIDMLRVILKGIDTQLDGLKRFEEK